MLIGNSGCEVLRGGGGEAPICKGQGFLSVNVYS